MTPRLSSRRSLATVAAGLVAGVSLGIGVILYPAKGPAVVAAVGARRPVGPRTAAADAADTRACPGRRPAGWLAAENRRPGDRLALPAGVPTTTTVVGFADRPSAACGDLVAVRLSGPPAGVQLAAYRVGWYGGAGARMVWRSRPVAVARQPVPDGSAYPHLVEPKWRVSTTIAVDGRWTPGLYLLVPLFATGAPGDRPAGPAIPLTVRDDVDSAPIVFKASTLTWAAYGDWGGWSLYHGRTGNGALAAAGRARVISLRRPLTGAGYLQFAAMDLPVVRQVERLGLDVGYLTDEDVEARPTSLLGHAEIVSGGHSEYWTRGMYDALLLAADTGVNLVFLGANNLWWQARLERSADGDRPDRMAVYRIAAEDPVARAEPARATVLWADPRLGRDPAAVLGESHAAIGVRGGMQVLQAPAWFLAGSGLTTGSVLPQVVGNEADGLNPRARNPANTQVLAAGVLRGARGPVVVSASYSTFPSGAAVFAAGSTDWACVPSADCFDGTPPAATAAAVAALTRNVLLTLATPRAGRAHPSTATVPFVAAQLLPQLAPAAIGSYGGATPEID
ncbi:MAG TPA: N,N-dimethylformamidase beta subunit family domain-containing protein [Kineosporiaceae bacterium]